MVYQLKAKTDKDYVFAKHSPTNFFSYTALVEEVNSLMNKLPDYLNPDTYHWNLFITDVCLANKYGCSYSKGYTDYKEHNIYIPCTLEGVYLGLSHEIGHMVDAMLGISDTKEWQDIFAEFKRKYRNSTVFQELGIEEQRLIAREFFAEAFQVFLNDKYFDLYSKHDYIYFDNRSYFRELYCFMGRCVDLLFFKKNNINVLFYE